jgi:hypothetical protein
MKDTIEVKFGSVIYDRISTVRMSDIERQTAINAMRDADAIVDAIMWITRKIEQLGAFLFMKPSVKH